MNHLVALFLLLAAVVTWTFETVERTRLTARIESLRLSNRGFSHIREDHERLRRREPFPDELLSLRRDAAELAGLRREMVDREQFGAGMTRPVESADPFPAAQWSGVATGKNLGRATPQSALQTALWAAAHGEIPVLREVLDFEPAAPFAGKKIRRDRSDSGRPLLEWMAKNICVSEVQLLAEQRQGTDDAVVYSALRAASGETKATYLHLRRDAGGWRLLVPANVVEKAEMELAAAPAR